MDSKVAAPQSSATHAVVEESFSQPTLNASSKDAVQAKDLEKYKNTDMCPRCDKRVYHAGIYVYI